LLELEAGTRGEDIQAQEKRLATAEAELSLLDVKLKKSTLCAPYDAEVVRRLVDEGAVVTAGQTVLELHEFGRYEARFSLPLKYAGALQNLKDIKIQGTPVAIDSQRVISSIDDATRSVDVVFSIASTAAVPILPGQTCTLTLEARVATRSLQLPVSALVPSIRGMWSCYRLEPEASDEATAAGATLYRVKKVDVTVLHTDGRTAYVETAVPGDALVVADGTHKIAPGMLVQVVESAP
jgi:RND family efflux transporter MFP subunit